MKVLSDANIVLDVLLAREPPAGVAVRLLTLVDNETIEGAVCAATVTTIAHVAGRSLGARQANRLLRVVLDLISVAAVAREVLEAALRLGFAGSEDAVVAGGD